MEEQIKKAVRDGHNILILGQAGTGKTCMLKPMYYELEATGKSVQMTATTGIAATLLPSASTIHSFFGIMDGRFSDGELIERVTNDTNYLDVKRRIEKCDVLMVDEISMLSLKLFLQIEVLCRNVRQNCMPFGGIQVILSGDLYQLKPVPSTRYGDPGCLFIEADNIKTLVPHHFILKRVYRQTEDDLVTAVQELSRGELSTDTSNLIQRLHRTLPPGDPPVKLFALNYDVGVCNSDHLLDMPGETTVYRSADTGDPKGLEYCNGEKCLYLKMDAPVVLIVNMSAQLVNGLQGKVVSMEEESVDVHFPSIQRTVKIVPFTFNVFDPTQRRDTASRKQIPLRLAFAFTVHRAQGLSLDRLEVDCRNMYNPGQIGVAIGRAKAKKGLKILNFTSKLLRKHSDAIVQYCQSVSVQLKEDKSCCTCAVHTANGNGTTLPLTPDDEDPATDDEHDSDAEMISEVEDLEAHLSELEREGVEPALAYAMPEAIDIQKSLESAMYEEPATQQQTDLNSTLANMTQKLDHTKKFATHIWNKFEVVFQKCIPQVETGNVKVANKHTTAFYKEITLFQQSAGYTDLVKKLFQTESPKPVHYRACYCIIQTLRGHIVKRAVAGIQKEASEINEAVELRKGSIGGRGKLRYIGGWCIAKLKFRKKQAVRRNLYKKTTKAMIKRLDNEVRHLEQLIEQESYLLENSTDKDSLLDVRRKQNLTGGLTNISDSTFNFFETLDVCVQQLETEYNMNRYGKDFYIFIQTELDNNVELCATWMQLFTTDIEDSDIVGLLKVLYGEVIRKYLRMSTAQFRRDYIRKLNVQKQAAHREQIKKSKGLKRKSEQPTQSTSSEIPTTKQKRKSKGETTKRQSKKSTSGKASEIQWPCPICQLNCETDCVACDSCDSWFHAACVHLSIGDVECEDWFCETCKAGN